MNIGPVANAGGPYTGTVGSPVGVNGSQSVAPTGSITRYAWDFGDGTRVSAASATASHSYNAPGTFNVTLTITDNAGATATATGAVTISGTTTPSLTPTPPTGTPGAYNGVPASVPGTIEAENFDTGGQGVSYYDTTAGNSGGQYRSTDVDIQSTTDAGGGYNVGWMAVGEWMKYTVNVTKTGTYNLQARVASAGAGGTFHVEVNGVDRTGAITIPNTGGWQNWQTVTVPSVTFATTGLQVVRVVADSAGPSAFVGNLNYLRVVAASSPYRGTPGTLPGRVEAEDFDEGGEAVAYHDTTAGNAGGQYRAADVDIEVSSGGGYNVGWMDAGEWLTYTVNVTATATYTVALRVASTAAGGTVHVEVNGVNRTGPLVIPATGGWQSWQTVTANLGSVNAGIQVIRVVVDARGSSGVVGNLDYLWFSTAR
jgi:hypothetical protein